MYVPFYKGLRLDSHITIHSMFHFTFLKDKELTVAFIDLGGHQCSHDEGAVHKH